MPILRPRTCARRASRARSSPSRCACPRRCRRRRPRRHARLRGAHERDALDPGRWTDHRHRRVAAEGDAAERRVELTATAAHRLRGRRAPHGIEPGATAEYRVEAGAERASGTMRAQPYWSRAGRRAELTIAIGSCFFLADADPQWPGGDYGGGFGIFDAIAASKPDVMLWLGDNLYLQQPDFYDPASMAARYRRQRAFAPLQKLLTATSASRDLGRSRLRPQRFGCVVRAQGRDAEALPALLAESRVRAARGARRVRHRALRRRAVLPARRSLLPFAQRAGPTAPTRPCSARASSNG